MLRPPYAVFVGDASDVLSAKTGFGVAEWRRELCVGQVRLEGCVVDLGLEDLSVSECSSRGARTMIVGLVNAGGRLSSSWRSTILEALSSGLDVAAGMHSRLSDDTEIFEVAERFGRELHDVRFSDRSLSVGTGRPRSGLRLLTVGTDCSVGKKYVALALEREMRSRGMSVDFRATGQTGVMIAGDGIAIDAVKADFISGAAEMLSPSASADHWDVIEGQGSLFHPSFAGVSLGLLHGSQPDAFVACHAPGRELMRGVSHPLPSLEDVVERTILEGRLTNPRIRCVGAALNTSGMSESSARSLLSDASSRLGVCATDAIRFGTGEIAERLVSEFSAT